MNVVKEAKGLEERREEKQDTGREGVPVGFCDDKAEDAGGIPRWWEPMAKTEASSLHSLPPDVAFFFLFFWAEKM